MVVLCRGQQRASWASSVYFRWQASNQDLGWLPASLGTGTVKPPVPCVASFLRVHTIRTEECLLHSLAKCQPSMASGLNWVCLPFYFGEDVLEPFRASPVTVAIILDCLFSLCSPFFSSSRSRLLYTRKTTIPWLSLSSL